MSSKERDNDMEKDLIHKVTRGEDGFSVPEGYFAGLQDKVLARVETGTQQRPALTVRIRQLVTQPAFAYAALITGLLIAFVTIIDRPVETDVFAAISGEDAYAYVYQNIEEYSATELASIAGEISVDDFSDLTADEINIALDDLLNELSPEDLDELF